MIEKLSESNVRLHRLDHLRALAALMILMWHFSHAWMSKTPAPSFPLWSLFEEGHTGVSLFCVISGFILTRLYYDSDVSYRAFLTRRTLRILPLFLLIVFLSYYVSTWDVTALVMMLGTGLVRGGLPSYAGPGWSVLIEFQFYVLFPFILIFIQRYGARYLIGVLLVFLLLRCVVFAQHHIVQDIAYYTLFGRMDQFVFGMMTARLMMLNRARHALARPLISITVFVIAVIVFSYFYRWFNVHGGLLELNGEPFPSKSALWIDMPTIEAFFYSVILLTYLHLPALPSTAWTRKRPSPWSSGRAATNRY